ncbi:MAG: alpha/beta hydrolase [Asgard group archaeon]|nr:alpha/beta hydrolase [Asgard group archaeon]
MVRRPQKEYWLENETKKKTMYLSNGAKIRVLCLSPYEETKETKEIIFYSGFISYIYLWRDSVKKLRKNHNLIFIETREKEFSAFPPDQIIYSVDTLGEDFVLIVKELGLDLDNCVVTGSSIASVGVLEAMSKNNINPFLSVHSSPQATYKGNNKINILAKYLPYWFVVIAKPIVYLIYKIKFRRDPESGRSRIHTLSRMLQKSQINWMKKLESFMPKYEMQEENVKDIKSPVIIVGGQDDPEHDTESVRRMVQFIPGSKFRPVPFKNDTHGEAFANIILEEIENHTSN